MRRQPANKEPAEGAAQLYAVPALEKALDVLELLSQAQQALGLNQIAEALNRSHPALFRITVCLHNRGYLLRDASGRYRRNGGLVAQSAQHPGSCVHAAPLVDSAGNLVAVLSLTRLVPASRPSERRRSPLPSPRVPAPSRPSTARTKA